MKIGTKLLIVSLIIGIVPLTVIGLAATLKGRQILAERVFNQLENVREHQKSQVDSFFAERQRDINALLDLISNLQQNAYQKLQTVQEHKKSQLEWYFQERLNDIRVLANNSAVIQALEQFDKASQEKPNTGWPSIEEKFGPELKYYKETKGYDDLLLISAKGRVVYSVAKRSDWGPNVITDSPLANSFHQGLKEVTLQDFAPYAPADNRYTAFLAAPLSHFDKVIGVVVLALSPHPINTIVQRREGMGQSGETYLVGEVNGRTSYRSDRVIKKSKQNLIGHEKSGEDIDKALAKQSGIAIKKDSWGRLEWGAYAPLQIPGLQWCIITSIDLEEFLTPTLAGDQVDFFTAYVQQYDYHDLLLIHPQGDIFYTVKHEADYGTNILTGEYANSHLGKLVKQVLQTKTFQMSDYAPYAPSHSQPAAFMAQPLLNNNEVELIVVVQLNNSSLNRIMQERTGMGETGEAYLVGGDQLMRSNSFLAPQTHSITASFAHPETGKVVTESSRAALAGATGKQLITNYRGDWVLSTYVPIKIGEYTWALIAEISQAEAFAPIMALQRVTAIVALLGVLAIILVAWGLTKSITRSLRKTVFIIKELSNGQLVTQTEDTALLDDELGLIRQAVFEMSEILSRVITDIQSTVTAAKRGELTRRVTTGHLQGFMKELGESTNELVLTTAEFTQDLNRVTTSLAAGSLQEQVANNYQGIYAQVVNSLQMTTHNFAKIIAEIQAVVNEAGQGKFDRLIDLSNKQGFTQDLSEAVNTLLIIQKSFTSDISYLLRNLKAGDLTQPISTDYVGDFDQIKQDANSTIDKLVKVLSQIQQSADALQMASREMESNNSSLATRNEEQASSLEETASVMEQLTTTVEQNAHHAQNANQLIRSASEVATRGETVVAETVHKMRQINTFSQKIVAITEVINAIVFQTNMLAINAAIEAARAGEHGRGFSIVALEVRNLAQRTAQAAEEIKGLINDSVSNVGVGLKLVEQVGNVMEEIIVYVKQVKDMLAGISSAAIEQAEGIKQINHTVLQMDKVTQQNATFVEAAAIHAENLVQQAANLAEAFKQFKLN